MDGYENTEVVRLWRVHKTVHQMAHDRGYIVAQSDLDLSLADFSAKFTNSGLVDRNKLVSALVKKNDPTDQLFIFFPEEMSVGVKTIKTYVERMGDTGAGRAILVYRHNLTPPAVKAISNLATKYALEPFAESELIVNITEHELVPKHIVLNEDEKNELLARYRLKETHLPRIQTSDPVARYLGLKRGQVVKILRNSETAGRYVTYRLAY